MPGLPLRTLLPLLLAGSVVACGPLHPQKEEPQPQRVVELGGAGGGQSDTAVVRPLPKPAHPAPPPAKPGDAIAESAPPPAAEDAAPQPPARTEAPAATVQRHPPRVMVPAPPSGPRPPDAGRSPDAGRAGGQDQAPAAAPGGGLSRLPSDPTEVRRLRTRPPMTPPVDTAFDAAIDRAAPGRNTPAGAEATADARCREAVRAARDAVNRSQALPPEAIPDIAWVEEALRVTEVAARACQGQPGEEAATYWRATAFFLHGQYARAALNFRRVADMQGPFNALGYAGNLATLLTTCADDRTSLDAFRLGGLFEAAGHLDRAAAQYTEATRSPCAPLRDTAESRLRVIAERITRGASAVQ